MASRYRVVYETRQQGALGVYEHRSVEVRVGDEIDDKVREALDEAFWYFQRQGLETRFPVSIEKLEREERPERFGGDER